MPSWFLLPPYKKKMRLLLFSSVQALIWGRGKQVASLLPISLLLNCKGKEITQDVERNQRNNLFSFSLLYREIRSQFNVQLFGGVIRSIFLADCPSCGTWLLIILEAFLCTSTTRLGYREVIGNHTMSPNLSPD